MNAKIEAQQQAQAAPRASAKQIGDKGFIIFDGTGYYYVTEDDWLALEPVPADDEGVLVAVEEGGKSLFVNLDMIDAAPTDNT